MILAITILGILAGTAAIKLGDWDKQEKMKAAQLAVFYILQQTRVEAITRGTNWNVANTLQTAPYNYPDAEADLTHFVEKAADCMGEGITVTPDDLTFDARGRCTTANPDPVTIAGMVTPTRIVNITTSGLISLP
jgi:type II secretory pathway pseudopilin PulG